MADAFDPDSYLASKSAPTPVSNDSGGFNPDAYLNEKTYGTAGQQVLTGLEGAAQGVIGPIAPAIEELTGLTTGKDIRAREETNPVTHGLSEAAGFAGSLLVPGLGEASLAGQVGNIGEHALALVPEGARVLGAGVKAGAEMAALATSTELSKLVERDPNQTLGSAAINVGLSGLIGGAGGVALGSVSSLWNKAKNVTGVEKLVTDFQNETHALQQAKMSSADALNTEFEAIPASEKNLSPGVLLARWANEKGSQVLAKSMGETAASTVGAGLGALVGHPIAGAWMGDKVLAPVFSALAKPFAENMLDASAAKASVDYLGNVIKGQNLLNDSISNLFSKTATVLTSELIPDQESRDKLQKSLDYASIPNNAINVGGKLAHYLPSHATALAETTAQATNYLNSLKPTQPIQNPLDTPPPINKANQAMYNRALDVAEQPLLVLEHVKNATLLPQDVATLQKLYPGLHSKMVELATNQLIKTGGNKTPLSYSQRVSLNLLMGGHPLDGTMTPQAMQSIIASTSPKQQAQSQQTIRGRASKASGPELSQINKVNALSQTASQARQTDKRLH